MKETIEFEKKNQLGFIVVFFFFFQVPMSTVKQQKPKGTNFYRDPKTLKRLKMYNSGRAVRNKDGKIISQELQSRLPSGTQHRIEPNRKWFENTRVVGMKELEKFRDNLNAVKDPYQFVTRTKQLPLGLLDEKQHRMHILEADPFNDTFGPKATRKRPKLTITSMDELALKTKKRNRVRFYFEIQFLKKGSLSVFGMNCSRSSILLM
jgi:hypothetical protein